MNKKRKTIFFIILLNIIILLPLFFDTIKIGHDITFHLSNIDILSKNMTLESFINGFNIRPDIANNMGYGIGIFYPMLPHLIGAITYNFLSLLDISIVNSVYFLYFFISVVSSILIYNISVKIHQNNMIAILSSLIYIIMPYFVANMFVRFAYNEVFFFMFFLMMINGLFYYNKDSIKKFYLLFIIGYTGMILSHLVLSLFASIFFIIYLLINIKCVRTYFKPLIIGIGIVSIIVFPNILLLLKHQLSNIYTFNQPGMMTSVDLVTSSTLNFNNLATPQKGYYQYVPCHIPVIVIILMITSLVYIIINKKKFNNKRLFFMMALFGISLFMILPIFPWKYVPKFLLMIQFPWRLEGIMIIGVAVISPLFLLYFKDKKYFKNIMLGILIAFSLINIPRTLKINTIEYKYSGYELNDAMGHQMEYLPYKTLGNWNEIDGIPTDDTKVKTTIVENKEYLTFEVTGIRMDTRISLPKLYYYGYTLKCDNGHYHELKNNNGYISSTINHNGNYKLEYAGTISYIITRLVRFVFIILITIYLICKYIKKYKI